MDEPSFRLFSYFCSAKKKVAHNLRFCKTLLKFAVSWRHTSAIDILGSVYAFSLSENLDNSFQENLRRGFDSCKRKDVTRSLSTVLYDSFCCTYIRRKCELYLRYSFCTGQSRTFRQRMTHQAHTFCVYICLTK